MSDDATIAIKARDFVNHVSQLPLSADFWNPKTWALLQRLERAIGEPARQKPPLLVACKGLVSAIDAVRKDLGTKYPALAEAHAIAAEVCGVSADRGARAAEREPVDVDTCAQVSGQEPLRSELEKAAVGYVERVKAAAGRPTGTNVSDAINIAWARLRTAVERHAMDTDAMKGQPAEELEARASADHEALQATDRKADGMVVDRGADSRRSQVSMTRLDDAMRDTHLRLMQVLTDKGRGTFASRHELESVIREECGEVTYAVHRKKSVDQLRREVLDLAAVCVFAVACIEHGAMDW